MTSLDGHFFFYSPPALILRLENKRKARNTQPIQLQCITYLAETVRRKHPIRPWFCLLPWMIRYKFELGLGAWNNSVQLPIMQHSSNPEDEKNVFLEVMFNLTLESKQDLMKLIQICDQYICHPIVVRLQGEK